MNWQWLIDQGLISGQASHYTDGVSLQGWEYSHAISTAYNAASPTQRRQLVDMLWSTGIYGGQKEYFYDKITGEDFDNLVRVSSNLKTIDYTATPGADETAGSGQGHDTSGSTGVDPGDPVPPVPPSATDPTQPTAEEQPATGGAVPDGAANDSGGLSRADLQLIYRWMPSGALNTFIDAYLDKGSAAAWGAVRNSPQYETWFPGNMDQYGNIRYTEDAYAGVREAYRDVLRSVGLEPNRIGVMESKMIQLMEGEVSPAEFQSRVDGVYNRIISASDQIKQFYADQHGISDLTTEDLLFGALDPEFGRLTMEEGYRIAEVGGAASEAGFTIDGSLAELVSERGVTLDSARQMFGQAQHLVPVLDTLAARHYDPDDDFNLHEFLQSEVFNDPGQNLRMRRLIQRERSSFGRTGSFQTEGDKVTGLTAG